MDDRDPNEHEVDTGPDENSKKKRRTVSVINATGRPLTIRQHDAAVHPMAPRLPSGDAGLTLQNGSNHGVDKEWFDAWLKDNANLSLVTSKAISAVDEPEDEAAEEDEKAEF